MTYSSDDPAGCGTNLGTATLINPVLSSAPLNRAVTLGAQLVDSADWWLIRYPDTSGSVHTYSIDKQRKVIVRYQITEPFGYHLYDSWFLYALVNEFEVLEKISFRGRQDLRFGGILFHNIATPVAQARGDARKSRVGSSVVWPVEGRVFLRFSDAAPRRIIILTSNGRVVHREPVVHAASWSWQAPPGRNPGPLQVRIERLDHR